MILIFRKEENKNFNNHEVITESHNDELIINDEERN